VRAKLAQQLGAERVDRSAFDLCCGAAEPRLETMRDLAGGFVRECECADARWVEFQLVDEKADAFRQTERLSRTRTRKYEERAGLGFDRLTLRRRRHMWGV